MKITSHEEHPPSLNHEPELFRGATIAHVGPLNPQVGEKTMIYNTNFFIQQQQQQAEKENLVYQKPVPSSKAILKNTKNQVVEEIQTVADSCDDSGNASYDLSPRTFIKQFEVQCSLVETRDQTTKPRDAQMGTRTLIVNKCSFKRDQGNRMKTLRKNLQPMIVPTSICLQTDLDH